jgi:hypothetical protein
MQVTLFLKLQQKSLCQIHSYSASMIGNSCRNCSFPPSKTSEIYTNHCLKSDPKWPNIPIDCPKFSIPKQAPSSSLIPIVSHCRIGIPIGKHIRLYFHKKDCLFDSTCSHIDPQSFPDTFPFCHNTMSKKKGVREKRASLPFCFCAKGQAGPPIGTRDRRMVWLLSLPTSKPTTPRSSDDESVAPNIHIWSNRKFTSSIPPWPDPPPKKSQKKGQKSIFSKHILVDRKR